MIVWPILAALLLVGCLPKEVPFEWKEASVYTMEDVEAWQACGAGAHEAREWAINRVGQQEACRLQRGGVGPDEYRLARRLKARTGSDADYIELIEWFNRMELDQGEVNFILEDAQRLPQVITLSGGLDGFAILRADRTFDLRYYDSHLLRHKPDMTPQEARELTEFAAQNRISQQRVARALGRGLSLSELKLWISFWPRGHNGTA